MERIKSDDPSELESRASNLTDGFLGRRLT